MSDAKAKSQPQSLEEALKEIADLKSQLSGSDLEVFSQNRNLKAENLTLKEEIRQLTEQCVSQTMSAKKLEKAQVKLQEAQEELQAKLADFTTKANDASTKLSESEAKLSESEAKLAESENKRSDSEAKLSETEAKLGEWKDKLSDSQAKIEEMSAELDVFRSREVELSQELERVTAENSEHSREFESKIAEFDKTQKELQASLSERDQTIQSLESRVEQFKEEFLSQESVAISTSEPDVEQGRAFALLTAKMEGLLGFPGRALVEQVFRLSEVPQSSSDPEELEQTFEALQDTATTMVRSPEQEAELASVLKECWDELGLGSSSNEGASSMVAAAAATAAVAATAATASADEVEPDESADETPELERDESETPQPESEVTGESKTPENAEAQFAPESVEAPAEEEAPKEAVAEDTAAEEATEEAATEEAVAEDAAAEEAAAEETVAEEAAPEEAAPEEAAPEEAAVEEVPDEAAAEGASAESAEASSDDDEEEGPDFDKAAKLLEDGEHSAALPIFERLVSSDSEEVTYKVGHMACLAGLEKFQQALEIAQDLKGLDVGDSREVFDDALERSLLGLASSADSDLVRKECFLELIELRGGNSEETQSLLDQADEIAMRIEREGELSLLQARHRIAQDDVTEYLIDALQGLSDGTEAFGLLKTNLERYPDLSGLTHFLGCLLESSRADSLEAESSIKEILGQGETIEELLDQGDPGEEAVVQVFLEHLIPRSELEFEIPSEDFEELMLEAEPAAFVGSLRQALRSVDYTLFFEEIDVQEYDGDDTFLLRTAPEPKPTLLFGPDLDEVPPEELRFLVLRELFSTYRRHSHLAHISAGLDDAKRIKLVKACVDIFSQLETPVAGHIMERLQELQGEAGEGGQDELFKGNLAQFLREVYISTESDSFLELGDFLYDGQLNKKWLDSIADGFAAKQTGIVVASYAICRDQLNAEEFSQLEENGFSYLYECEEKDKYTELRLRLQRLWVTPLKALISEPEE